MIVDASVAAHWFVPTEFSTASVEFRNRLDLVAPSIILIETSNTLYKNMRKGVIASDEVGRGLVALGTVLAEIVEDRRLLHAAVDMAVSQLHPVYDCLYLALAVERRDVLATADRRLAALADRLGVGTRLIRPDS